VKPGTPVKPGDIVKDWHDAGCVGMVPVLFRVIRVNRKTLTVMSERGEVGRRPYHLIDDVMTRHVGIRPDGRPYWLD
jgi:hypothetical protein